MNSHHSTTSELTPLYDQRAHTTLRPLNSHHSTTSELTPLCNTVNLRLHATYPHIHSIHKSRRSRHWTWEGDHCGLDHQWPHQYNEGKDRPEKLPSTWFQYELWTGCTWAWTGHVSHLASVQLFLLSTTTPMHSTGSWLATMGPSCYTTWMTSSWLALPAKTPVRRPCTACCWCATSWASQWPLRSWRDPNTTLTFLGIVINMSAQQLRLPPWQAGTADSANQVLVIQAQGHQEGTAPRSLVSSPLPRWRQQRGSSSAAWSTCPPLSRSSTTTSVLMLWQELTSCGGRVVLIWGMVLPFL